MKAVAENTLRLIAEHDEDTSGEPHSVFDPGMDLSTPTIKVTDHDAEAQDGFPWGDTKLSDSSTSQQNIGLFLVEIRDLDNCWFRLGGTDKPVGSFVAELDRDDFEKAWVALNQQVHEHLDACLQKSELRFPMPTPGALDNSGGIKSIVSVSLLVSWPANLQALPTIVNDGSWSKVARLVELRGGVFWLYMASIKLHDGLVDRVKDMSLEENHHSESPAFI